MERHDALFPRHKHVNGSKKKTTSSKDYRRPAHTKNRWKKFHNRSSPGKAKLAAITRSGPGNKKLLRTRLDKQKDTSSLKNRYEEAKAKITNLNMLYMARKLDVRYSLHSTM